MQLIFFIVISLAGFAAAAFDADWFMQHRRVRFLVQVHGRPKARIILLSVFGAMAVVGSVWLWVGGTGLEPA